jgi:hypothetical protein
VEVVVLDVVGRFVTVEPAGGLVGGLLNPPLVAAVRVVEVAAGFVADDEVDAVGARRRGTGAVAEVRLAAAEDAAALGVLVLAVSTSAMVIYVPIRVDSFA